MTVGLLVAAAVLFVGSVSLVLVRARAQMRLEEGSQRVSVWYTSQALVELQRFRTMLLRHDRGDAGVPRHLVEERYEIMLSRLPLLVEGEEATARSLLERPDVVEGLRDSLAQLDADVHTWHSGDVVRRTRIEAALDEADQLLTGLNLALHAERKDALDAARSHARVLTAIFVGSLLGLLVSGALLLLLIWRGARRTADAERTLRVLVDALPVGVAALDTTGRIVLLNEAGLALTPLDGKEAAIGLPISAIDPAPEAEAEIARVFASGQPVPPRDSLARHRDGTERTLLVSTAPVFGAAGAVARVVRVAFDVTEQRSADRRIRHLAEHDTLTDLPNRLLFGSRLKAALRRAEPGRMVAVHCIDLDHFKEVNDSLGHPVGDQLLLAATARMQSTLREGDMLARLGGDEFAVVQVGLAKVEEATTLAARLCTVLSQSYRLQGYTLRSGASIGTALAPEHGMTVEALLSRADIALYRAKGGGRGRAEVFTPEQEAGLRERRAVEEDLRRAIANDELFLAFQPKFRVATRSVHGCEALLRWTHPEQGAIPPGRFIPVAEETGLIHPITRLVLEKACRQAMLWRAEGLEIPVAVNLSAGHFGADQGVQLVREALAATGCDPALLEVEVTEGVFLRSAEAATRRFTALRAMGVRVSLDDFGTGYSSLGYLQHLPFDVIKVDRTFIAGLDAAGPGRRIVDAIVRLAHGLGAEVVAEGVETEEQLSALQQLGCDHVQGFLLGRPLTPAALAALARREPAPATVPAARDAA